GLSLQNSVPSTYYNAQGLLTNWQIYVGYSYWVDRGIDYKPAYDISAIQFGPYITPHGTMNSGSLGADWTFLNADWGHEPALNPQSGSGTLLVTDNTLFQDAGATTGLANLVARGANSNHVDGTLGNFLPAGSHEMYNDGSVRWVPMSNIKARILGPAVYFGW
ncbi:MAG: hypothetical protein ACP5I8_17610, partial [Phycisphaerae bacterium]